MLQTLDNVDIYEVEMHDMSTLIDNIFINIHELNRLFENRFRCKLFCPPVSSQSILHNAVKGKNINFTDLVATIGLIINEIWHKEIDTLLTSKPPPTGSINKINALLDEMGINYDNNTIRKLRTLYSIRSKTFPLHEAGPEIINLLKRLDITFPINQYNDKESAYKILQGFNLCLIEMKGWFNSP